MESKDDPVHNILPRPEAEAEHERFFEDGEEPPARYDLPDLVDYIEVNPEPIDSARWRKLGWKFGWSRFGRSFLHSLAYWGISLPCLFLVLLLFGSFFPFFVVVSAAFYAEMTLHFMMRMTGDRRRFGPLRAWKHWVGIALAYVPVFVSQVIAVAGVIGLGIEVGRTVSFINAEIFYGPNHTHPLPSDWFLTPVYILAAFVLIGLHCFVAVRVGGFATHLILDYDLGPSQAIRANWRVTRGRTRQLMRLKLRYWVWKSLIVASFYGIWLLVVYEPYTSAVWTAAYLDIAGSEPPRELQRETVK